MPVRFALYIAQGYPLNRSRPQMWWHVHRSDHMMLWPNPASAWLLRLSGYPQHRNVGGAKEVARRTSVGRVSRRADADADRHGEAFDRQRRTETPEQRLDRASDVLVGVDEEYGELVAAEAGNAGVGREAGLEPVRERGQYRVAELMAEAVVDVLEVVEIHDERRREQCRTGVRLGQRLVKRLEEAAAVDQPRQRVVVGFVQTFERLAGRPEHQRRGD